MENTSYEPRASSTDTNYSDADLPRPGAVLASARVAGGASVEDVARALKLSVAQVKAIEADDHSQLPPAVFVRGFIRNYARLLGVDIGPLLPAKAAAAPKMDEHLMHRGPGIPLERRRHGWFSATLAGATFMLVGLAYYEFALNTSPSPHQVAVTPSFQALPSNSAVNENAAATSPDGLEQSGNLALKKSIDPTSGANEKGLHFLFNGESWVEVRDGDGKIVFSRINAPGSERIVHGDPPFNLVIGGASGVQLSYNGSRVDLASYVNEDVARLRLE